MFDVVVLGPDHGVNIAGRVSRQAFLEVKAAAAVTLRAMRATEDPIPSFEATFRTDAGFFLRYDQWIRVVLPKHPTSKVVFGAHTQTTTSTVCTHTRS